MKHAVRSLFFFACVVSLIVSISSCSSGGGEVAPQSTSNTSQAIVSGLVQAPGGQIAFFRKSSFGDLFSSEAYAALIGFASVSDGTVVELGKISQATPFSFSLVSATVTTAGRYTFDLTNLGLSPSSDLIVRVKNGAAEMRAFVTGPVVDLNPVTEAAMQVVLQQLGGQQVGQLTLEELNDINGAANLLANLSTATTGNVQQTVDGSKILIAANGPLADFILAAVSPGQTNLAVGDIGNFFPYSQGNSWEYRKTRSVRGSTPQIYTNTHSISGIRAKNGVDVLIYRESDPENNGAAEDDYILKTVNGLIVHGSDPTDEVTPQVVPYQAIRFPLSVASTYVPLSKRRITVSGLPVDFTIETKIEGFESVTVPSGTYPKALKLVTNQVATLVADLNQTVTGTQTVWLVSNLGIVKSMLVVAESGNTTGTEVEELVKATIDGVQHTFGAQIRTVPLAANDLVYDQHSDRIYASLPGNPGSITVVNPHTGSLGPSVAVGNQPSKLALSTDGQELYVALDGEAAIRRVHLPTFSAQEKLLLGANPIPGCGLLLVSDMEILPENARVVIVSKKHEGCSPAFVEVAVYENGTQKPNVIPRGVNGIKIDYLEPASSPATVFGASASGPDNFFVITVDAAGLSLSHRSQIVPLATGTDIETDSGMLFTGKGQKFDPITRSILGEVQGLTDVFTVHRSPRVRPDLSTRRLFFLPYDVSSGMPIVLMTYDASTLQHLGTSQVHNGISGCSGCTFLIRGFIRWGVRGIAFTSSNGQITLVESALIP